MKLLFISYWGIEEGLTEATVIPHLKILADFERIEKIIFCSIERTGSQTRLQQIPKVFHEPLISKNLGGTFLTKAGDFVLFTKKIVGLCREHQIDLMICRSSLAGTLGYRVFNRTGIPYIVESFEPHAEYMIDGGTWRKFSYRSLIQQRAERKQKETALFLAPVSSHYSNRLIREGINPQKIMTMPCCISIDEFAFKLEWRKQKRKDLKIKDDEIVGIYVGKFGDIYYTDEAYDLYREAFDFFKNKFRLIILTSSDRENLSRELRKRNIPLDQVCIDNVPHAEVPQFLSAADFAFSTIKPSSSRIFCSPIKNGEYWANGLPILTEPGIGEDSDIISSEGGGIILDRMEPQNGFKQLKEKYLSKERQLVANEIVKIAEKHRKLELVRQVYSSMLSRLGIL